MTSERLLVLMTDAMKTPERNRYGETSFRLVAKKKKACFARFIACYRRKAKPVSSVFIGINGGGLRKFRDVADFSTYLVPSSRMWIRTGRLST